MFLFPRMLSFNVTCLIRVSLDFNWGCLLICGRRFVMWYIFCGTRIIQLGNIRLAIDSIRVICCWILISLPDIYRWPRASLINCFLFVVCQIGGCRLFAELPCSGNLALVETGVFLEKGEDKVAGSTGRWRDGCQHLTLTSRNQHTEKEACQVRTGAHFDITTSGSHPNRHTLPHSIRHSHTHLAPTYTLTNSYTQGQHEQAKKERKETKQHLNHQVLPGTKVSRQRQ